MAWKYNPFTDALDQTGSGGASYIDGVVADPTALPVTLGTPPLDSVYLAKAGSGVWLINRRPSGLYVRVANNGNLNDWLALGAFPEVNSSTNWELYDGTDPTKELKFDLSGISTGTVRTLTVPNASGTLGWLQSVSSITVSTDHQLTAARNQRVRVNSTNIGSGAVVYLPAANNAEGDRLEVACVGLAAGTLSVRTGQYDYTVSTSMGLNEQRTFIYAAGSWTLGSVESHTHAGLGPTFASSAFQVTEPSGIATNRLAFSLSGITAGATRTLTVPDNNGTIALTSDFAAPPAIGNTTRNTVAATTMSATGAITGAVAGTTSATSGCNGFQIPVPAAGGASAVGMYGAFTAGSQRAVIFGAGTSGSTTTLADFSANGLVANSIQNTPIGSTTPAAGTFTTLSANNGTIAASAPALNIEQTWNGAGVNFIAAQINAIRASGSSSSADAELLRLSENGTEVFRFRRTGQIVASSLQLTATSGNIAIGSNAFWFGGAGSAPSLTNGSSTALDLRNQANAMDFRIYGQFTTTTNFERLSLKYNSTATAFQIGTEKGSGGGAARALQFQVDGTTRFSISAAGALSLGSVITVWENTAGMYISSNTAGINFNNGLSISTNGGIEAGSAGRFRWKDNVLYTSGSYDLGFQRNSAGVLEINNGTAGTFRDVVVRMLDVGGTTNAFPALKNSSTTLQVRLANDSDFAPLECAGLTLNGNLDASTRNIVTDTTTGTRIGTGTTQLLGFWNATPATQPASVADATDAASTQARLNDLLARLRTIGIIAT